LLHLADGARRQGGVGWVTSISTTTTITAPPEAFAPYFDDTLAERVAEARQEWFARARERLAATIGPDALDQARRRYAAAIAEIEAVNDELASVIEGIDPDGPDEVEAEPSFDTGDDEWIEPIGSSDMSFVEESQALLDRKRLAGEDDDDDDDD
jgi:hypothetical protein